MNDENAILTYFMELDGEAKVVIESMSSWYWLYDLLTVNGLGVVI
jgi:hypothetical protein